MLKFKLSGTFMLAVICIAVAIPLLTGLSVSSAGCSVAFVAIAASMIEPGESFSKHPQAGEVGEQLKKVESEYKEVAKNLKEVGDQLKTHAENAQKELKRTSDLSESTKASVDKLLTEQGSLQARLQHAEQLLAKVESQGASGPEKVKSLGERVIDSDAYKNFDIHVSNKFSVPVHAAITSITGSGGALIETQRVAGVIATPTRRMTIRDLCSQGSTESNLIEYVKENVFTNSADVVSENPANPKPESGITYTLANAPVKTIAHWIRASKQVLDDAKMLSSLIDARLRYGLALKEEAQLLKGSGTGLNINGIYTQATAYSNPGVYVQNQTRIDQIRIALLQAELAEYYADGIVLNPIDWAGIELLKTEENSYLFANPHGLASATLWARPVVATQAMSVSDFLVGAFKMGAQVWDREDATVVVSTEDRDNFVKNMVTILAEERLALTVYRPDAFVKGEFEDISA